MLPIHLYSAGLFHIQVRHEYWALKEGRLPLNTMLGDMRVVAHFINCQY